MCGTDPLRCSALVGKKRESLKKRKRNCVAQTGSLLFRRLAAGGVQSMPSLGIFGMSSQRRRPRIAHSRHSRLPACATTLICVLHKAKAVSPGTLIQIQIHPVRFHLFGWRFEAGLRDARRSRSSTVRLSIQGHVLRHSHFTRKQAFVNRPFCSVINVRD